MSQAFLIPAKNGDIANCLPLIQRHHKSVLIVNRQYEQIARAAANVEPHFIDGDWQDLKSAMLWAKQRFNNPICLSVFGKDFPVEHRTPSFTTDQWERGGAADQWDTLPLVLNHNGSNSPVDYKTILYADHSESSPFRWKNEMAALLAERFPDYRIVRLSEVRLHNPVDFLAWYNRAALLVSIETMHLHLSRASRVPTVALVADQPSRWNGTAWQKRFAAHVRYVNWADRKEEIVRAIENVFAGRKRTNPPRIPTKFEHGYNPSIIRWKGRTLAVYRYHPEKTWLTRLAIQDGKDSPLLTDESLDGYSHEDPRFFEHDGKLWLSLVLTKVVTGVWKCVIGYGELTQTDQGWKLGVVFVPKFGRNDWSSTEKNWVFFSSNNRLFAIYGIANGKQTVLEIDRENIVNTHVSPAMTWPYGVPHGGAMIRHPKGCLRFFHSYHEYSNRMNRVYYLGAALMDAEPPFAMRAISQFPIHAADERWTPGVHHFKPNICFPSGAIEDGNGWLVAFGANDCECCELHVSPNDLNLAL